MRRRAACRRTGVVGRRAAGGCGLDGASGAVPFGAGRSYWPPHPATTPEACMVAAVPGSAPNALLLLSGDGRDTCTSDAVAAASVPSRATCSGVLLAGALASEPVTVTE